MLCRKYLHKNKGYLNIKYKKSLETKINKRYSFYSSFKAMSKNIRLTYFTRNYSTFSVTC